MTTQPREEMKTKGNRTIGDKGSSEKTKPSAPKYNAKQ